jgi:hypothetical protein
MITNFKIINDWKTIRELKQSIAGLPDDFEVLSIEYEDYRECSSILIACSKEIKEYVEKHNNDLFDIFQGFSEDLEFYLFPTEEFFDIWIYGELVLDIDDITQKSIEFDLISEQDYKEFKEKYLGKGKIWISFGDFESFGIQDGEEINTLFKESNKR